MRKQAHRLLGLLAVALTVTYLTPQRAFADNDDPPSRVARLSYARGSVSFEPAGTEEWVSAVVNRPMTTGDKLWADSGAQAELHIGSAALRLAGNTGFSFLNLDDRTTQVRLTEGTLNVRVRRLDQDETFEIDTPNLAFSILRAGNYKIYVDEAGETTVVTVRAGQGEVTGGGSAYDIHSGETGTFSGTDQLSADVQGYGGDNDDFDRFCSDRDRREDRSQSSRYVSSDVIGYEDLDDNGGWRPVPEYGTVWFPHTTIVGWAPYRYGHWVWISPWGWTWVDDAPWGFAPFHYGRWVTVGGVWGWVPCPPRGEIGVVYVRPVYAPALVAWVGGPHFSIGIGIGGGGEAGVAWFPLGPREVFVPSYRVSRTYVTNVNVSNTTVNNTVVNNYYNTVVVNKNVTNIKYVNQAAPNAVTATSQQNFASAQPVGRNMIKVDQRAVASAQVNATSPTVAPQQKSVLGAGAAVAAQPPARVQERAVVAKTPPPPAPVSFAKQQQTIQANGGRPPAISELRQTQPQNTQQARANAIKIAPPATPATPQNVQTNRPSQPQNNNANPPGQQPMNPQNNPNKAQQRTNTPNNADKPPVPSNPGQSQSNVQNNANRPPAPNNATSLPQPNQPANPPAANGRNNRYNDRPASARPNANPVPAVDPQVEQKHHQQLDQLRQKQDQERQKVEQKQVQEQQKIQQRAAEDAKRQQVEQKQQQQLQQLEQKHAQEQQKLEQKQQQERQKQQDRPPAKPPKNPNEKPPNAPR